MATAPAIDSAKSLLGKLERSFGRRHVYGEAQLDWVFDMAITAWHIVDWRAIETGEGLDRAKERLKNLCPELAVCEQLCNGAKHLELRDPKLAPFDVSKDVRQTNDLAGIRLDIQAGDTDVEIVLTPVVVVTDKERREWDAIELFRRVLMFWRRELA
jgi:hypothetical protein